MSIDKVDNGYMIVLSNKPKHRDTKTIAWYYSTFLLFIALISGMIWKTVYRPKGRYPVAEKVIACLWFIDIAIIIGMGMTTWVA